MTRIAPNASPLTLETRLPHAPLSNRTNRAPGVVLVAALLAMTLLASAVFFVFNVGTHLHRRIEAQHAADAAAIAGAGWVARTLNLVAINNVESAKLLTQVQIYDGLPSAVRNAARDAEAALEGVDNQIQRGLPGHPWLDDALQEVRIDLLSQIQTLISLETALNENYDIREMTQYDLPGGGRGSLWAAIESLEQISLAAMQELGVTAQIAAWHAGASNLSHDGGRAFLVPFVPEVPWEHGQPADFIDPILDGRLPEKYDHEQWARGPFDALFGLWRPTISGNQFGTPEYTVINDFTVDTFRDGPPPLLEGRVIRYDVQPIYAFFEQQLARAESAAFDTDFAEDGKASWFGERAINAAQLNMDQLRKQMTSGSGDDTRIKNAHWESNWDQGREVLRVLQLNPSALISQMYIRLVFEPEAVDAAGDPIDGSLSLESWAMYPDEPAGLAQPGGTFRGGIDRTGDLDVLSTDHPQVRRDERILEFPGENGTTSRRTQYIYTVWCAIEDRSDAELRFPNNFASVDDLPAPVQLDITRLRHNNDLDKNRYLRFFAAADQPATAALWSGLFESGDSETPDADGNTPTGVRRPWRRVVATASAEVFNNHSWDLWTQMWHAQLVPVGDLDAWLTIMKQTGSVTEDLATLVQLPLTFSDDVGGTFRHLQNVSPLMEALREPRRPRAPLVTGAQP